MINTQFLTTSHIHFSHATIRLCKGAVGLEHIRGSRICDFIQISRIASARFHSLDLTPARSYIPHHIYLLLSPRSYVVTLWQAITLRYCYYLQGKSYVFDFTDSMNILTGGNVPING
jgi:hypothetical protein